VRTVHGAENAAFLVDPHLRAFSFWTGAARGNERGHGHTLFRLRKFLEVCEEFFHDVLQNMS
jgi:hypothetical protein